ncbi:MAG TPA: hypothetical protein PKD79_01665 [Candidatus Doudnabacteria bacterium]|nr:hypothetical protein [Candidatus Doudnabacteria bacterium]
MPEEIRTGRVERDIMNSGMQPRMSSPMGGRSNLPWIILAAVILLLIVGAILFRDRLFTSSPNNQAVVAEEKLSGYQAVFLTNGQVYFGKLSDMNANYATLIDIYYLQVTQPPLQGSAEEGQTIEQQPQLSLVKLGQELHGPDDLMKINRDHILFYEDIKESGRVMEAIREYQANPNGAAQQQQQQQPQQPQPQPQQQIPSQQGQ